MEQGRGSSGGRTRQSFFFIGLLAFLAVVLVVMVIVGAIAM